MSAPRAAKAAVAAVAIALGVALAAVVVPQVTPAPIVRARPQSARIATLAAEATATVPVRSGTLPAGTLAAAAAADRAAQHASGTRAMRTRPVTLKPGRQRLPAARDVVFFVPHADDESLFAAEVIARYRAQGTRIHLVYTTDSAGGEYATTWPEFRASRARVRRRVIAPLGRRVSVAVAPIPDGNTVVGGDRRRRILQFLRKPGVVPAGAVLFAIGGDGNSDHVASFTAARTIARDRRQPLYVYWAYGHDGTRLDPYRTGLNVAFSPSRGERAYKRWAVSVYEDLLYRRARYAKARPQIMGRQGDDVVTVLRLPSPR